MHNINIFLSLLIFLIIICLSSSTVYHLEPGTSKTFNSVQLNSKDDALQVFCYRGRSKYIIYLWQSVFLQIDLNSDNFVHYEGSTPAEVAEEYNQHRSGWSLNLFSWKYKNFKLDPFNQSCIGIQSYEKYTVHLNVIRIDYWKVLSLIFGITLFVSGSKLSRNTIFYYLCAVSFGICASFLILIYLISKLFPKKPMMYGVVIGGWTVGVYLLQILWDNVRVIMTTYQTYVFWYIIVTGIISFLVCYRFGPVTNKRSQNIIQWMLQGSGLILIFNSSHFQEAAMGQVVILLIVYNFPKAWVSKSRTYWKRRFPPKVRLISNDEYYEQGVKFTSQALSDLRKYCSSPHCNQWKTALKLRDVKRFASFIEGTSHLTDSEILEYESSINENDVTDDDSDEALTEDDE